MQSNWRFALLAVVLAVASWYMVTGREKVETWVDIPIVTTKPPEGLTVRTGLLNKIQVKLRGPKGMLRNLDPNRLSYTCDLGNIEAGRVIVALRPEDVKTEGAIQVSEIKPSKLTIEVEHIISRKLPVKPVWTGTLPKNWELQGSSAYPPDVDVRGPESVIKAMQSVYTQEFTVPDHMAEQVVGKAPLLLPEDAEATPDEVGVRFLFGPHMVDVWVTPKMQLPTSDLPKGSSIKITPQQVRLHLEKPETMPLNKKFRNSISVHLPSGVDLSEGTRTTLYRVELPEGVHLLQAQPSSVKIRVSHGKIK